MRIVIEFDTEQPGRLSVEVDGVPVNGGAARNVLTRTPTDDIVTVLDAGRAPTEAELVVAQESTTSAAAAAAARTASAGALDAGQAPIAPED
jgi:hypothetical protein